MAKTTKPSNEKTKKAPVKKAPVKKAAPQARAVPAPASPGPKVAAAPKAKSPAAPKAKTPAAPTTSVAPASKASLPAAPVERTRYSDEELQEFRDLIHDKLEKARVELDYLQQSIKSPGENATDDSFSANKLMEDNSMSTEKEHMSQLADRMRKFVKNLEDALVRIENKTYGICKATGKLIGKDRLRAVPHTTMSIEAKMKQSK